MSRGAGRVIHQAEEKMWGGYSEFGRRALLDLTMSEAILPENRAKACYALARQSADTGQVQTARRMMAQTRRYSTVFMRQLRPRLLESDLLMRCGDLDGAGRRLREYHEMSPAVPDYWIGLANLARLEGSQADMFTVLGDMMELSGLERIVCDDPEAPFLSLRTVTAPPPVEDGPRVSVLMSSYNSAETLHLAVGCMQAQSWRNLEIIVTDDCSTDDSRAILHAIARADPRVTVIENTETAGTYGNRNAMLARCTGDFVTVHDSDDWSHPQMIERQVRHLMETPDIRVNTTLMCRVLPNLDFKLRPSRNSLEYCHQNYPGFMFRREDVVALGGWDPIMANADAEFERRIKLVHGKVAFAVIDTEVPFSFFLMHENSLTQQKTMNLRSLTFGSRHEYHRQAEHWLQSQSAKAEGMGQGIDPLVLTGRSSPSAPFPAPNSLMIPALRREVREFDVLIMSDLFLQGGTRGCNINYVRALHAMGCRVGLFHWPRADLRFLNDIDGAYRDLCQEGLAEIVTWEDSLRAKRVIVHHPPIASHDLDSFPRIEAESAVVLVNQLPFQTTERDRTFYDPVDVTARLARILGVDAIEWLPISPLTRDYLLEWSSDIRVSDEIWYPPYVTDPALITRDTSARLAALRAGGPATVRHTRDHWTKWPASAAQTRAAYVLEGTAGFTVLGGSTTPERVLSGRPESWTVHDYDGISVPNLLNGGDVYLNFNEGSYIEEFGRNVMEAMAFGLPVIADAVFGRVFGDDILTVSDCDSQSAMDRLRAEPGLFEAQVARGQDFVHRNCGTDAVTMRMERFLG